MDPSAEITGAYSGNVVLIVFPRFVMVIFTESADGFLGAGFFCARREKPKQKISNPAIKNFFAITSKFLKRI
jgi:hypothetical protein